MTGSIGRWHFAFGRVWQPRTRHIVNTQDSQRYWLVQGVRLYGSWGFIRTRRADR